MPCLRRKRWYTAIIKDNKSALQWVSGKNDRQQLLGIHSFQLQSPDSFYFAVVTGLAGRPLTTDIIFNNAKGASIAPGTGKALSVCQGLKIDGLHDISARPNNRGYDTGFN